MAVHRDLTFGHRFEQCRLRARRGPVDFVGQHDVGEDRPGAKFKTLLLALKDRQAEDVGRQHVVGELNALPGPADGQRQRMSQRRLADPGQVLNQQVAATEQGCQGEIDDLILVDDDAVDDVSNPAKIRRQLGGGRPRQRFTHPAGR